MSTVNNFLLAVAALKIIVGLSVFADLPFFLFRLMTGGHHFAKGAKGRIAVDEIVSEPAPTDAAVAGLDPARQSGRNGGAKPGAADRRRLIVLEIAPDGRFKLDIPSDAFDGRDGAW